MQGARVVTCSLGWLCARLVCAHAHLCSPSRFARARPDTAQGASGLRARLTEPRPPLVTPRLASLKVYMAITVKLDLTLTQNLTILLRALQTRSLDQQGGERAVHFVALTPTERVTFKGVSRADSSVDFTILSARPLPTWLLNQVGSALSPMSLRVQVAPEGELSLTGDECVLIEHQSAPSSGVWITGDDTEIEGVAGDLEGLGLPNVERGARLSSVAQLTCYGAPPSLRRRLAWASRQLGLSLPPAELTLSPDRVRGSAAHLHLPSGTSTRRKKLELSVSGDSLEALLKVGQALDEVASVARFDVLSSAEGGELPWFELDFGALSYDRPRCAQLYEAVRSALNELGCDEGASPLKGRFRHELEGWEGSSAELEALWRDAPPTLMLPFKRYERGLLHHPNPEERAHWQVRVYAEDSAQVTPLRDALTAQGYVDVALVARPASAFHSALRHPARCPQPVVDELRALMCETLEGTRVASERCEEGGPWVSVRVEGGGEDRLITLSLQSLDPNPVRDQRRLTELSAPCSLSLKCEELKPVEPLWLALKRLGAPELTLREGEGDERAERPVVVYGGASLVLIEHLQALVERTLGERCELDQRWGEDDQEVWIQLPSQLGRGERAESALGAELADWFPARIEVVAQRALVERQEERLLIADLYLERARYTAPQDLARVPRLEDLEGYCLDQATSESLYHVAEAVALGEPCLLEGPTSASKTSVISYLAGLLDQPVARLNLSAQTDTGELIGRFSPAEGGWRWVDGLVVESMTRGWWLILDELNLAEPQVLERLNSLLERHPSLTLSERDGRLIGGAGAQLHERFRIFATMNPAEYIGRAPLSPAYRDRWLADRHVTYSGERALYEMIALQVWGRSPEVELYATTYQGRVEGLPSRPAPLAQLATLAEAEALALALARFHHALAQAVISRPKGLGLNEGGASAISRRSLLATLDYLRDALSQGALGEVELGVKLKRAVWRYYVSRLKSDELRSLAYSLWESVGLEQLSERL